MINKNHCLLVLDPGKMTGYGIINLLAPLEASRFGEAKFEDVPTLIATVIDETQEHGDSIEIVSERFVIMEDTIKKSRTSVNWSIELIGVARWLARMNEIPFELQGATDAKKIGTDKLLRRFGWWTKGSDHARDAARHAILYIARKHKDLFDKMLKETEGE